MNEETLLKRSYYTALDVLKKIKWVILATVLCGMAGFIAARLVYTPEYESSTTFIVKSKSKASNAYTSLTQAQTLVDMLDALVTSDEFENVIINRTGWEKLPGEVYASVIPETNLIVVGCTADNPRDAFICEKIVMEICPEMMHTMTESAIMTVFRTPTVAVKPSNTSGGVKYGAIAAFLGFAGSIALFAYLSYNGKTINDSSLLGKRINTVVLQSIPYESRGGIFYGGAKLRNSPILIGGIDCTEKYEEAVKGLRHKIKAEKKEGALAVVLSSTLPNEGKSTVASNLALSLAMNGSTVALVDLDVYNCSLAPIFPKSAGGVNRVEDFIFSDKGYSEPIKKDAETGMIMFFGKKTKSQKRIFPVNSAAKLISTLRNYADYIIIDTPPISLFADSAELADSADISFLVVREHFANENEISEAISVLKGCKATFVGCVFNFERLSGSAVSYGYGKYGYEYGKYGYGYGKYGEKVTETDKKGFSDYADDELNSKAEDEKEEIE